MNGLMVASRLATLCKDIVDERSLGNGG
jgi:hypothetical protein